jgi:hypothetical protein
MPDEQPPKHVLGETYSRKQTPTFEFKASSTGYTGGGYARVRSNERRADKPGDGTHDVFASIHRLMAVVHCYPADKPLAEIQNHMVGRDVHHTLRMPSANLPDELEVRGHGEHSEITQADRRAWAEDEKRAKQEAEQQRVSGDVCDECGDADDVLASVENIDGQFCVPCATEKAESTGNAVSL